MGTALALPFAAGFPSGYLLGQNPLNRDDLTQPEGGVVALHHHSPAEAGVKRRHKRRRMIVVGESGRKPDRPATGDYHAFGRIDLGRGSHCRLQILGVNDPRGEDELDEGKTPVELFD